VRIVLDTNVLVSAHLSAAGATARVLRLALSGALRLLFDERILDEYREVLGRERFGFDSGDVAAVLEALVEEGERVAAQPLDLHLTDPGDLPFIEVAVAGHADAVVTGNAKHFRGVAGVTVLSPRQLLALFLYDPGAPDTL